MKKNERYNELQKNPRDARDLLQPMRFPLEAPPLSPFIVLYGIYWLLVGLLIALIPGVRLCVEGTSVVYLDVEGQNVLAREIQEVEYSLHGTCGEEKCRSIFFFRSEESYRLNANSWRKRGNGARLWGSMSMSAVTARSPGTWKVVGRRIRG